MKVYLVLECVQYEGSSVLKVFASESMANEYADLKAEEAKEWPAYWYEVEEMEVE
jgi:hypothetical protein